MKETVVVGMSGGVDSSVAAWLLKEQGYNVIGVTMQIWPKPGNSCCGITAAEDARRVAYKLSIPFYVMNFEQEFQRDVIDYFVQEYQKGRTPNPCIACNRYVKWEALLEKGRAIGADYLATGHYARIARLSNGRYTIQRSVTEAKDQTYALYNLTQDQLAHTLMPVGEYHKSEIRKIAKDLDLIVADKPDSQEICFIPDHDYASYIEEYTGKKDVPGNFVTPDGEILGQHKGITHYTIGQRKGLGLALGTPCYVSRIRPETNEVVVGGAGDVWNTRLVAGDLNYMAADHLEEGQEVTACIRYSHKGAKCQIKKVSQEQVEVVFAQPVRAATPGQAVVFYEDDYVLGGGTILSAE